MYGVEAVGASELWASCDVGGGHSAGKQEEEWARVPDEVRSKLNWIEVLDGAGLCTRPGRVHKGGNSGYQAINLAYLWGASRIILLGFDFQRSERSESHFHGDHEGGLPNLGNMPEWSRKMIQLGADLRERGVEVVNATRRTAITCFERLPIEKALSRPVLFLKGMLGLGDNIYQRAVLRELTEEHEVWLETPWPQIYADLPIRCVRPETKLRTQARNVALVKNWAQPPGIPKRITYADSDGTILECLCRAVGIRRDSLIFDLPKLPKPDREPYIVIRPATERVEWPAASRNPRPEYLAMAAERLRRDFHIVSVADLVPGVEWPVLPLPYADETYHAGELGVEDLLALVAGAVGVVGGVGWLVPAAVAAQVPMLCIFGGWGFHNGPQRIFDKRMDTRLIHQAIPERFCMCGRKDHACDKRISDIESHVERFVGLLASRKAAMATGDGARLVSSDGAAIRPGLLAELPGA